MSDKPTKPHSEEMYRIPFIEHEYRMFKVSRKNARLVKALVLTNIAWFVVVTYILSKFI
jgi:hypothetical protein